MRSRTIEDRTKWFDSQPKEVREQLITSAFEMAKEIGVFAACSHFVMCVDAAMDDELGRE